MKNRLELGLYFTGEYSCPRDGESEGIQPNFFHHFYVFLQHFTVI